MFLLALETALAHEFYDIAATVCGNLSDFHFQRDLYADALGYLEQGLAHTRRLGLRRNEWFMLAESSFALTMLGRWDEALARAADIPDELIGHSPNISSILSGPLEIYRQRGDLAAARELLARHEELARSKDVQAAGAYAAGAAAVRLAEGNLPEALSNAERAFANRKVLGIAAQDVKLGFMYAVEAALGLDRRDKAEELLAVVEALPPGRRPPLLDALAKRFRARLAGGDATAASIYADAVHVLRRLELPLYLAIAQLEYGEWLVDAGREDEAEALLGEAREVFRRLGVTRYLERAAVDDRLALAE